MSKIIAIDFGLKRTGIAISDEARMFAFGLDTVPSSELMTFLKDLKQREKFSTIALGMPLRLDNTDAHISENVRLLKQALEKAFPDVTVDLVDERFTSRMASDALFTAGATKKQRRQKELVDKVSATIILQSYIDHLRTV